MMTKAAIVATLEGMAKHTERIGVEKAREDMARNLPESEPTHRPITVIPTRLERLSKR